MTRLLAVTFFAFTTAVSAVAAAPSDFYLLMLRRGIASYDGGRYQEAARPLRIAAFGALDSVEHYQTAEIYLALVFDRLKDDPGARDAASRVVAAERVEARYARLPLPDTVRTAFDALAKRLLTSAEAGWLYRTPAAPATTNPPSTQKPAVSAPTASPPRTAQAKPPPPAAENRPSEPAPVPEKKPQPQAPAKKPTPATTTAAPTPAASTATPPPAAPKRPDVPARLAAADRALAAAQLAEARRIYHELLGGPLERAETLRVAEGLYRARDFAGALRAFALLGTLRANEAPYNFYIAVARYETRDYSGARRALDAALPHIELTPDVARYRDKIVAAAR